MEIRLDKMGGPEILEVGCVALAGHLLGMKGLQTETLPNSDRFSEGVEWTKGGGLVVGCGGL